MSAFQSLMKDSVYIIKPDGRRLGPYQSAVSSDSVTILENAIDVDEGDHVARLIPSGKEEIYLVLSADFSHGLRSIPSSYILKVRKTTVLSSRPPTVKPTTINIHNSTGVQVGDYNTQHIQATFKELIQKIEQSSGTYAQKTEAKSRLTAFLEHPLVGAVLGGTASAVIGAIGGG